MLSRISHLEWGGNAAIVHFKVIPAYIADPFVNQAQVFYFQSAGKMELP